ncbi:6-phospho-3-hexuloisomerase [Desulforamulus hydrothermalis]|uniref:3-hexulose-6-phosphate isomerase n=1 Tax=Desulforamulus hydrothermalis Lam5 = DSM 18033 TaxID=1121428 RepID=K8EJV1_9FIRM|nr:6-phospho-3-hexuloisomerase [Desulforamulus hydrothermalis]CCO08836.1 3-hexulose-6-phosphate isomerase [Desulforamulus hydrothermalis Lam5 = DSM 18033]SHG72806.1 6-phospho-3-hexuloisomerase [Desulforamulus hydrothermalis Lam5 = DSM 18033]
MQLTALKQDVITELAAVYNQVKDEAIMNLVEEIVRAKRVFIYGLGRERLMLQAFAMRLMHLGVQVYMVGDVTTPGISEGDLFITSSGTGHLSTVAALQSIAQNAKARIVFITAHPEAPLPRAADAVIKIPAQTMKDSSQNKTSRQPMGSLFEQAQLLLLDTAVILLQERLQQKDEDMEKRHTNLE